MSIFDNYDNIIQDCPPIKWNYLDPKRPVMPFQDYNKEGELIGYFWYQGDSVKLEFKISGEIISDDGGVLSVYEYFTDNRFTSKKVIFKLYNFRYDEVMIKEITEFDSDIITIFISSEESKELECGVYHCSLDLVDLIEANTITLFDKSFCTFNIK